MTSDPGDRVITLTYRGAGRGRGLVGIPIFRDCSRLYRDPSISMVFIPASGAGRCRKTGLTLRGGGRILVSDPFAGRGIKTGRLFLLTRERDYFLVRTRRAIFLSTCTHVGRVVTGRRVKAVYCIRDHARLPCSTT